MKMPESYNFVYYNFGGSSETDFSWFAQLRCNYRLFVTTESQLHRMSGPLYSDINQ